MENLLHTEDQFLKKELGKQKKICYPNIPKTKFIFIYKGVITPFFVKSTFLLFISY